PGFVGSYEIVVTATDGANTIVETFTVTATNQAPMLAEIDDVAIPDWLQPATVVIVASDPDDDELTFSASVVPGSVVFGPVLPPDGSGDPVAQLQIVG